MLKRETPAGESSESPNKVVKVKTEKGEEEINVGAMSVEVALAVLSNLPLHIKEGCTLSNKEKACAIKCAKLALLEKDGQQARSQYIRQELVETIGGEWVCIVGGFGGMSLENPHIEFKYGEDSILIMKSDSPVDLPIKIVDCKMEDSMKTDAIHAIKTAFLIHKRKLDIAKHIRREFDTRYKKYWACCIYGPDGSSSFKHKKKCLIICCRGQLNIALFKNLADDK